MGSYSEEVVNWWDALAARARGQSSEIFLETGRKGERFSLNYEEARTGKKPRWLSVESNLVGYDLLSQLAPDDSRTLQIEVKATEGSTGHGFFHITRNEWETGLLADNYAFHLWTFGGGKPALAVLDKTKVAPHIPTNKGSGNWESVEIPFASFTREFIEPPVSVNNL